MRILSEIKCRKTRIGGEQHREWIGGDSVTPMPSSSQEVGLSLKIMDDNCGAYVLSYYTEDNVVHGLISFQGVEEAKEAVRTWFAIPKSEWQDKK